MNSKTILLIFSAGLTALTATATPRIDLSETYNMRRALEEVSVKNNSSAKNFLSKELSDHPENGYAYFLLATILEEEKDYGEARSAAEKGIKYIPKKKKDMLGANYALRSRLKLADKDTLGAYIDLDRALKLAPTNEDILQARAQLFFEQDRLVESDRDFDAIHKLNPGGVVGRMGLGRNASERGEFDKALEYFTRVAYQYPDYSEAFSYLAHTYLNKEDYLHAIDNICTALEIDSNQKAYGLLFELPTAQLPLVTVKLHALSNKHPHTGEYLYYCGQLLKNKRKYAEAIDVFNKCYAIDEKDFVIEELAQCYSEIGVYNAAINNILQAREENPENLSFLTTHAEILGAMGNLEGAIYLWCDYILRQPDDASGYYRRGFYEDNLKMNEAALNDYNMATLLNPSYAYAYMGRGDVLMRIGRRDDAMEAFKKVVELDTVPQIGSCAMYALYELGRKEEARSFMKRYLQLDSLNPGVLYEAACLASLMGDHEKSMQYLKSALENGYVNFAHARIDDDLEPLRQLPAFNELIAEYEEKVPKVKKYQDIPLEIDADTVPEELIDSVECERIINIPYRNVGGLAQVECKINGLPLDFIFDTGASDVSLSQVEANFMMKNGYLSRSDVIGTGSYYDAIGNVSEGTVINLRRIDFGGVQLNNVRASVVRNQQAPLLLGQSVLGKLGKIEINNRSRCLIIHQDTK